MFALLLIRINKIITMLSKIVSLLVFVFLVSLAKSQNDCACDDFSKADKATYDTNFKAGKYAVPISISKKLLQSDNNCCKAQGEILFANIHLREKKLDSVLFRINKANKYLNKKYDSVVTPETFRLRGMVCAAENKPDSAIYYYLEGLKNAEQHHNLKYEIIFCNEVSYTFGSITQPEESTKYMKMSLERALEYGDNELITMGYSNLATSYGMMYESTKNKKYLDSMQVLAPLALKYAQQANSPFYMIKCYNILGGLALEHQDFETAILYCDTVIGLSSDKALEQLRVSAMFRKGQSLYALGKFETSLTTLLQGLAWAKEWGNDNVVLLFYQQLYYTYKDNKNPEAALQYFEKYKAVSDSLMNIEKTATVNQLEQQYNKAKNEQTITELNQEKQISALKIRFLVAGVVAALLIAITIFLYYRQKNLKHQQTILETEQRLNRARMNPHFFFNALTALQSYALLENDGKQLASNLSKFSHIMRETLESSYKDYVTIEQEVDFLREYLELQKMRFPAKFSYHLDLVKDIETDEIMIPSMIIQPFVENSIEHGFNGITYTGELKVLFDEINDDVIITIIDNGKGLHSTPAENNEHISRASQIIKDRIYLLNIKLKTKASFSINNNTEEKGVIVKIYLPKIYKNARITH